MFVLKSCISHLVGAMLSLWKWVYPRMVLQGKDSGEKGKDWDYAALICAWLDPIEMREVTQI